MAEQFKVNDKVRISVPRSSDVWKYDDKEGIIINVDKNSSKYNIQIKFKESDLEHNPYYFSTTELEKLN